MSLLGSEERESPSREALLVVDMVNDFLEKGAPLQVPEARGIIPHIEKRIREARSKGRAVIFVSDAHEIDDKEFKKWPPHAVEGTRGAQVIETLRPEKGDFTLSKHTYSAFLGTNLESLLRELKVGRVYITGILTNVCVFLTAAEASMRNYEVIIFQDSVAALSEDDHQFALDQRSRVLKVNVS